MTPSIDSDTVLRLVAQTCRQPPASLTPRTDLYADLQLDSLGALELLVALEDAYGVDIGTDDARPLRTIDDIVGLLRRLKGSEGEGGDGPSSTRNRNG